MIIQQRYSLTFLLFLFALTDFSVSYAGPRTFPVRPSYRKITPRLPMRNIIETLCDLLLDNDTTCIRGIANEPSGLTFVAINNQIFIGNLGTGLPDQPAVLTFNDGVCGMDTYFTSLARTRLYSGSNVTLSVNEFIGTTPTLIGSINVGGTITDVSTLFITEQGPVILNVYTVYGNTVEYIRHNLFTETLTSIGTTTIGSAPICNIESDYWLPNQLTVTPIVWILQNGIVQAYTSNNNFPLTLTPLGPPLSVPNQTICGLSVFKRGSSSQTCSVFISYNSTVERYTFDKLTGIYTFVNSTTTPETACVIEATFTSGVLVGQCDSFIEEFITGLMET